MADVRPDSRGSALKQLALGEIADEAKIGGEEVVVRQVGQLDPAHLVENLILDFAGELPDSEELQIDGAAVAVIVADANDCGADNCLDTKFFVKLARQCLLRTFAGLDLAPGKFPLQGHNLVGAALAYEQLTITDDEGGRYKPKRRAWLARSGWVPGGVHCHSVILLKN